MVTPAQAGVRFKEAMDFRPARETVATYLSDTLVEFVSLVRIGWLQDREPFEQIKPIKT